MTFLRHTLNHLAKDLRIEWRSRENINGVLFFALLVVIVVSLAFDPTSNPSLAREISGGILWIAILFASVTALSGSWTREQRNGVLDAQRLAPSSPAALFLGKVLANFLFVSVVELILAPVFAVFYNLHPLGETRLLLIILPLGTWALIVNGTFFAAISLRARSRELLLPLLLLPIVLPALLGAIQSTAGVLTAELDAGFVAFWIRSLLAYDIIFTTLSLLLFGTVLNAE